LGPYLNLFRRAEKSKASHKASKKVTISMPWWNLDIFPYSSGKVSPSTGINCLVIKPVILYPANDKLLEVWDTVVDRLFKSATARTYRRGTQLALSRHA
jgi:hypothetical protein